MKKFYENLIKATLPAFIIPALIISFVLIGLTSCCLGSASLISSTVDDNTGKNKSVTIFEKNFEKVLEEANSVSKGWIKDGYGKLVWQPSTVMSIKVYQDSNTEKYFDVTRPIVFSVESDLLLPGDGKKQGSEDADSSGSVENIGSADGSSGGVQDSSQGRGSEKVDFTWDLGNGETAKGENIKYTFSEPGAYTVTLTARSGNASDNCIETIWVAESSGSFMIFNKYDCNVEVESIFTNNGLEKLTDVAYGLDIPRTIAPFQEVGEISTEPGQFKEKSNENGDLYYKFYFGQVKANKTVSVKANYQVIMSEFVLNENIEDIKAPIDENYGKLVKEYTKSEKSIDSDSEAIKNKAAAIIGQETDPLIAAKKLYDFVIDNMDYDWERYADPQRIDLKASELLDIKKGVCEDYSVLYAALCRAAGIPAKYIAGLPIMSLARDADRELESGHAWNEIYIKGYGWIPLDATSEIPFLSTNSLLNLRTYSDFQNKVLGFSWTYEDKQPAYDQQYYYRISSFDDSGMVAITMDEYQRMKNVTSGSN
jgi:transglutaminase-like putative cysteine protease